MSSGVPILGTVTRPCTVYKTSDKSFSIILTQGLNRQIRRMCEYLKKEEGERYMSLKAAPYAVEFYRKLGFHAVHEEEAFSGIRVTPMEKFL